MPSQSPTLHWSPSYLLQSANTGPMPWRIDGPQAGLISEENSGGSSYTAPRTCPGFAYADSHAASTPPDERPLTSAGARSRGR